MRIYRIVNLKRIKCILNRKKVICLNIDLSINSKEISIVIKDFIETYVKNAGCDGIVLGLSGGMDSAVTALLCKDALGKKNTKCVFFPDKATPRLDIKHQELIVKRFNLLCKKKDIASLVEYVERGCVIKPNQYALANIKARIRMTLLFEYANMTNSLVCGASNKSELLIGYFTKYGDGGVDFLPIQHLYKHEVREVARFLEIPAKIIDRKPTAGLWEGQTDEDELSKQLGFIITYEKLDEMLMNIENGKFNIHNEKYKNLIQLMKKNRHKIELPPNLQRKKENSDYYLIEKDIAEN